MKKFGHYVFLTSLLILGAAGYELYIGNIHASKFYSVVGAGVALSFYLGMEIAEGFNAISEFYHKKAVGKD